MNMAIDRVSQAPTVTPVSIDNANVEQGSVLQEEESPKKIQETKENQQPLRELKKEDVEKAVEEFNAAAQYFGNEFQLEIHEDSNRYKIDIIDKETKQVISELPPEEILDIVARFKDMMGIVISGLFLDKKA